MPGKIGNRNRRTNCQCPPKAQSGQGRLKLTFARINNLSQFHSGLPFVFSESPEEIEEHRSQRKKNIYRGMQLAVGQTACAELSMLRHVILYTSVNENRIISVVLHHAQCLSHSLLPSILSLVCRRLQLLKLWQKCQAKKMLERFALGWFGCERQSHDCPDNLDICNWYIGQPFMSHHVSIACLPQALSPGSCNVKHCHSCFGVLLHLPRCVA